MEENKAISINIVDDEIYCISLLEQYLINIGYSNISSFTRSADFLNQLNNTPDIVFLDYNMDNLNGIEVLKKIKRANPDIIVLFVSAQARINVAVDALKYGALDYIIKEEISEEKLRANMQKAIALKELIARKNKKTILEKIFPGFKK